MVITVAQMSRSEVQKIKLLALYDFLYRETDENNPLSTAEIIERLKPDGIAVERKALINDIKVLNEWGYEVQSFKKKSFYYYVGYRKFDTAELRVLMDAVQAARFINENKTVELCERIAELAGKNGAEILNKTVVCNNTVKHDNKNLFYTVDVISRAIEQKNKISFEYFNYGADKKKVYRKEKSRYVVNPLALVLNDNNYYLVCYNDKYKDLSNYRIDRMENAATENDEITPVKEFENFNLSEYCKQTFSMFTGELLTVELEVDNGLIDEILDRFGKDVNVTYRKKDYFRIKVAVRISPPFFAWIVQFQGRIKIKSPQSVKDELNKFISNTYIC